MRGRQQLQVSESSFTNHLQRQNKAPPTQHRDVIMLRSAVYKVLASTREALAEALPTLNAFSRPVFSAHDATSQQQRHSSTFAERIQIEFDRDPEKAAAALGSLSEANKAEVLRALGSSQAPVVSIKYLNSLFKSADLNQDGKLCKCGHPSPNSLVS